MALVRRLCDLPLKPLTPEQLRDIRDQDIGKVLAPIGRHINQLPANRYEPEPAIFHRDFWTHLPVSRNAIWVRRPRRRVRRYGLPNFGWHLVLRELAHCEPRRTYRRHRLRKGILAAWVAMALLEFLSRTA